MSLYMLLWYMLFFFFFKQKTAYEMRISDWSSDVCSSDLEGGAVADPPETGALHDAAGAGAVVKAMTRADIFEFFRRLAEPDPDPRKIGRASCRERVCQYV